MNSRKTLTIIMALSMILGSYQSFAQTAEELFPKAIQLEEVKGELEKAIEVYQTIVTQFSANRPISSKALLHIGMCYEKMGNTEARKAYERVVRDYADQGEATAQARVRLAALGGPVSAGGLVTRRVLSDASGVDGVLTADGKYISHIDRGTGDMVQFEVASGQTSRITNKGGAAAKEAPYEYQVFSRDGKQIVYSVESSDPNTKDRVPQLRIRNLDGSGLRTLYSEKGVAIAIPVDWSPDAGSILALCSRDKTAAVRASELTLISTADGSVRVLRSITSPLFWLQRASFSPDGRFVAFSFVGEGSPPHGDVHLMTADGRNEVIVAGHPAEDKLLRWTPDGRSLVFLSDRSGTWDIWTVHITGGKQQGEPELLKKDFAWDSMVL
ncbi:MAG: tetratricopeptide repeat protein, partial [Bacteroidales bacterium]